MSSRNKLMTYDSMPWTKFEMRRRISFNDGKFQNFVQNVKTKIMNMIQKIKSDLRGMSGANKVIYILGLIFKALSVVQLGKSVPEVVKAAKDLKGYCNDVDEFGGALVQSVSGNGPEVVAQVQEATESFGKKTKGNAKQLLGLKVSWGIVKPMLIWISGHALQEASRQNKEAMRQNIQQETVAEIATPSTHTDSYRFSDKENRKKKLTEKTKKVLSETEKRVNKLPLSMKDKILLKISKIKKALSKPDVQEKVIAWSIASIATAIGVAINISENRNLELLRIESDRIRNENNQRAIEAVRNAAQRARNNIRALNRGRQDIINTLEFGSEEWIRESNRRLAEPNEEDRLETERIAREAQQRAEERRRQREAEFARNRQNAPEEVQAPQAPAQATPNVTQSQSNGFAEASRYNSIGAGLGNRVPVLNRRGRNGYTTRSRVPGYIEGLRRRHSHPQTGVSTNFSGLDLDSMPIDFFDWER